MISTWTKIPSFTQSLIAGSFVFITNNTPKRTLVDIKQNKSLFFWAEIPRKLDLVRTLSYIAKSLLGKLTQFTGKGGGRRG